MSGLLENKVAIITGAATGIGEATAKVFAREGATVLLADINDDLGGELALQLQQQGSRALYTHADVSVEDQVRAMVDLACREFGGIDCAFNNAGITVPFNTLENVPADDWQRVIAINLSGIFWCMKYQLAVMKSQLDNANRKGFIVNTSSSAGLRGVVNLSPYVAAKHGVLGLTRSAALESAGHGIRVNAVLPGFIDTPMARQAFDQEALDSIAAGLPAMRLGRPTEVAETVVWLCSDRASFVSGEAIQVDMAALAG